MFTGIIQTTTKVTGVKTRKDGFVLSVLLPKGWKAKRGDSITVNGVCSTAVKVSRGLEFEYMPETLKKTNLARLRRGDVVNVEQSLKLNDRLEGHMVLGHVDLLGTIVSVKDEGNSKIFVIKISEANLVAEKGSVALEGISLTVVAVTKKTFSVHIIPHTLRSTNLQSKKIGDTLNVEFDVLAKYVQRLLNS